MSRKIEIVFIVETWAIEYLLSHLKKEERIKV